MDFKLKTRGANVSKEEFSALIAKLWESSLKPSHCIGGFRGAGLVPYSREHVLKKLTPSPEEKPVMNLDSGELQQTGFTCSHCGHAVATTPIVKGRIVAFFADVLELKKGVPEVGRRNNLRIQAEGEAITSDEFQELLEEELAEKEEKKKNKGKKATNKIII